MPISIKVTRGAAASRTAVKTTPEAPLAAAAVTAGTLGVPGWTVSALPFAPPRRRRHRRTVTVGYLIVLLLVAAAAIGPLRATLITTSTAELSAATTAVEELRRRIAQHVDVEQLDAALQTTISRAETAAAGQWSAARLLTEVVTTMPADVTLTNVAVAVDDAVATAETGQPVGTLRLDGHAAAEPDFTAVTNTLTAVGGVTDVRVGQLTTDDTGVAFTITATLTGDLTTLGAWTDGLPDVLVDAVAAGTAGQINVDDLITAEEFAAVTAPGDLPGDPPPPDPATTDPAAADPAVAGDAAAADPVQPEES